MNTTYHRAVRATRQSIIVVVVCDVIERSSLCASLIYFQLPPIDLSLHGNLLTCEATLNIDQPPLTKQITYVLNVNRECRHLIVRSSAELCIRR